jgi:5-formyltetrahydrofolate cyclo-ligase
MPSRKSKPTKKPVRKIARKSAIKRTTAQKSSAKSGVVAAPAPVPKPKAVSDPISPFSVRERKAAIRKEVRASLEKMRERNRRSKAICDAIISHTAWRRSTIVAIFAPMEHEPDIELLWKHAEGKTMCYPTIRQGGLDFIGVAGPESVTIGQFGFREPVFDQARVIPPDTFDLVLVPGAAFTANGDRLGRGGGFYDRLLSSPGFRAFKVGVCFDRQVLNEVPVEAHDQRVHRVVTESGWLQRPDFVKKR